MLSQVASFVEAWHQDKALKESDLWKISEGKDPSRAVDQSHHTHYLDLYWHEVTVNRLKSPRSAIHSLEQNSLEAWLLFIKRLTTFSSLRFLETRVNSSQEKFSASFKFWQFVANKVLRIQQWQDGQVESLSSMPIYQEHVYHEKCIDSDQHFCKPMLDGKSWHTTQHTLRNQMATEKQSSKSELTTLKPHGPCESPWIITWYHPPTFSCFIPIPSQQCGSLDRIGSTLKPQRFQTSAGPPELQVASKVFLLSANQTISI